MNSSGNALSECSDGAANGNIQDYNYLYGTWGSSDNGDVTESVGTGQQTFVRTYGYDTLNRLQSMSAPDDSCMGLSWTIDPWGNRNAQTVTGGSCPAFSNAADPDNHLTAPYVYDAAGNVYTDGIHNYYYDAENQLIQVDGTPGECSTATACYDYSADGMRVQKTVGGVATQYHYDGAGRVVAEYGGGCGLTCWSTGYVYQNGQLAAEYKSSTTYFAFVDHLGSTRIVSDVTGTVPPSDSLDYLPYGEQIAGDTLTTHKFSGKERDAETGLDNFGARYFGSSAGRFMTPDWSAKVEPVPYAKLENPQSLNLYTYVLNNPIIFPDLYGHSCKDEKNTCGGDQSGKDAAQNTNVATDTAVGAAKAIANNVIDLSNTINRAVDAALSTFTSFQFGQTAELQGSTPGESNAMTGTGLALLAVPIGGESEAVSVYMNAEKSYVGITNDLARRAAEHGQELTEVVGGLSRTQARGVEQAIIEQKGLEVIS